MKLIELAIVSQSSHVMMIFHWISTLVRKTIHAWAGRYRLERHYMRGTGTASKRTKYQP
jgi:hypothetical protein